MKQTYFNQSVLIRIFSFILLFLLLNGGLWGETAVFATPEAIDVGCTNGVGDVGELDAAIVQANSQFGHQTIRLGQDCTYRLSSRREGSTGLPLLRDDITIEGNGATIYRSPLQDGVKYRLLESLPVGRVVRVELKDLTLEDGSAPGNGGAYYGPGSQAIGSVSLLLENVTVRGNEAGSQGGGIYVQGNVTIINSRFENNRATWGGGLSWLSIGSDDSWLRIENNTVFSGNGASRGGGLVATGNEFHIDSTQFLDNKVTERGGGAYFIDSELEQVESDGFIGDSLFLRNEAGTYGGGINASENIDLTVYRSSLAYNTAATSGGGIYHRGQINLVFSKFIRNEAAQVGGVYSHLRKSPLPGERNPAIFGNVWDANEGTLVGDLFMAGDLTPQDYWIYYNTFVGRGAGSTGAIRLERAGAEFELVGNIITGYEQTAVQVNAGKVTTETNLYFANGVNELGVAESEHHIEADPLFLSETSYIYQLQQNSPAIDKGKPILFITEDLSGNIRPQGNGYDLGAYESPYVGNTAPEAASDSFALLAGETLVVDEGDSILNNDTDADGDELTAVLIQDVVNGELDLNEDGTFEYTPNPGFVGADGFHYVAFDGLEESEPRNVELNIQQEARDDQYEGIQDTVLTIDVERGVIANDANGVDAISVLDEDVEHGELALQDDGAFVYTPDAGFFGEDKFTYHLYLDNAVEDGVSNFATVTIFIHEQPNQPPVADDDAYQVAENETLQVSADDGVLANDNDADGDELEARLVEEPEFGNLDLDADGSFRYTPDAGFFGEDHFTYQADDGKEKSNTATVTIEVTRVNTAPVAVDDAYSVDQDGQLIVNRSNGVLANDSDADGDTLTTRFVSGEANGTFGLSDDGSFIYTPAPGFFGTGSFQYKADDGDELSNIATVTITVNRVNEPPVAEDDSYLMEQGTSLSAGVLGNDADGDGDELTAVLLTNPSRGDLSFQEDGTFTYTPDPAFQGMDSFTYLATDGINDSESATVTIFVQEVVLNSPPVAQSDTYETAVDTRLTITAPGVLANDNDTDGDALTAELVSAPENGTLSFNGDGSFTYDPNLDFFGSDSFRYQARDGELPSDIAIVTILVQRDNTAPVAVDDAFTVSSDTVLTVEGSGVLVNDVDAQGDDITALLSSQVANGRLVLEANGRFTYTPNPDFSGTDSFTYRAFDGTHLSNRATVTITVVAEPPIETPVYQSFLPVIRRSQ